MTVERSSSEPDLPLFRFSVAQYHAMRDAGILTSAAREAALAPVSELEARLVELEQRPRRRPPKK